VNLRFKSTLLLLVALFLLNPLSIHGQDSSAPSKLSDEEISAAIQADIQDASRIAGGEIEVRSKAGLNGNW